MCQKRGFDPKNSTGLSPSWCKGDRGQVCSVAQRMTCPSLHQELDEITAPKRNRADPRTFEMQSVSPALYYKNA